MAKRKVETVDEYLARGGTVQHVPFGVSGENETYRRGKDGVPRSTENTDTYRNFRVVPR